MKTRMFVAEVFWLFVGMYLCPQSEEQTSGTDRWIDSPITTPTALTRVQGWHLRRLVRPPPLRGWDPS
jgi:hypothetical protein